MAKSLVDIKWPTTLIRKAKELIEEGKVFRFHDAHFAVVGNDHVYNVQKTKNGRFTCECLGFKIRRETICSHILAVIIKEGKDRACREMLVQ